MMSKACGIPGLRSEAWGARLRLLALAALLIPPLAAQETTLRMDVKLVNLFVNVTDRNGAIVGGLTREILPSPKTGVRSRSPSSSASRSCR